MTHDYLKRLPFHVTMREMRLVRECGNMLVDSYRIRGEREDRQQPRYHEGKELIALAKRLARIAVKGPRP